MAAPRSCFPTTSSSKVVPVKPLDASYSNKPTFIRCCAWRLASSTPKASKPTPKAFWATRRGKSWTEKLWIYDLRTNKHFTLEENPLKRMEQETPQKGTEGVGAYVRRVHFGT